jgi:2'-5' RNA ligase
MVMKAAIALLVDYQTQNFVRKMVFELEQAFQIDFMASLLPVHISLKQPFSFESMKRLEGYFDSLADQIAPIEIELDEIYYTEWKGNGILGMNVIETEPLRELHNQLNRELSPLFKDTSAPHDGDGYHFHMTIELGKVDEKRNPYQIYFEGLEDKKVNLAFQANEIALFYYTGRKHQFYICYKILPLTG